MKAGLSEEILQEARAEVLALEEQAKEEARREEMRTDEQTEQAVRELKETALRREREAVGLALSLLV